jgi:hypothetical protein
MRAGVGAIWNKSTRSHPSILSSAGKPPQAAGDVGRPGAHTAHRRLQKAAGNSPGNSELDPQSM